MRYLPSTPRPEVVLIAYNQYFHFLLQDSDFHIQEAGKRKLARPGVQQRIRENAHQQRFRRR